MVGLSFCDKDEADGFLCTPLCRWFMLQWFAWSPSQSALVHAQAVCARQNGERQHQEDGEAWSASLPATNAKPHTALLLGFFSRLFGSKQKEVAEIGVPTNFQHTVCFPRWASTC